MNLLRRLGPAIGLFLLAPLVAEFLLGNLPVTLLPALVLLAPMYGGGALLIHEVTRRAGRGVSTMLALGVAYGLLEEGVATQSLFNPDYAHGLLDPGYVPALGIGLPWTVAVLALHAVWSTTVPIVLVELGTRGRRTTPWLGRPGLTVAALLFVAGIAANFALQLSTTPFLASPAQFIATGVAAAVAVGIGFVLPRSGADALPRSGAEALPRSGADAPGAVPPAWTLLVAGLGLGAVNEALPLSVTGMLVELACLAALAAAGAVWAGRAAWTTTHTLALAAAALLTYAWHAFPETPFVPVAPAVDLAGNVVFALGALALLAFVWRRDRSAQDSGQTDATASILS